MSVLTQAEQFLLEQIRRGDADAWSQFVTRYEGRLVAFARGKLRGGADAEDVVQETFMSFVQAMTSFREQASLETYLFAILRRKIINWTRGRKNNVCLLQDAMPSDAGELGSDASDQLAGDDPTASWYVRRDESQERHAAALTAALRELIDGLKESRNLRDLQIVEMLYYCQLRNKNIAEVAGVRENQVAVIKHRTLSQIRARVDRELGVSGAAASITDPLPIERADEILSQVWQEHRLSCPKRTTIGKYLLGTLEPAWHDYVAFHLDRLGCAFCQANLADLQAQTRDDAPRHLHDRILQSTVGFLSKP